MSRLIILGFLLFSVSISASHLAVDDVMECNLTSGLAAKYQSLRQRFSSVENALAGSTDPVEIAIATKVFNEVDPRYTPKEIKTEMFSYCIKALIQTKASELTM
jgi:hypothetical protein